MQTFDPGAQFGQALHQQFGQVNLSSSALHTVGSVGLDGTRQPILDIEIQLNEHSQ